nr:unnamed protein product [Naegleria fowleri]
MCPQPSSPISHDSSHLPQNHHPRDGEKQKLETTVVNAEVAQDLSHSQIESPKPTTSPHTVSVSPIDLSRCGAVQDLYSSSSSSSLTNSPRGRLDRYKLYSSSSPLKDSQQLSLPTTPLTPLLQQQHDHSPPRFKMSPPIQTTTTSSSATPKTPHLVATTATSQTKTPKSSSRGQKTPSSSKIAKATPITIPKRKEIIQETPTHMNGTTTSTSSSGGTSGRNSNRTAHIRSSGSASSHHRSSTIPDSIISASLSPVALKTEKRIKDPNSPMRITMHNAHARPPKHLEKFLKFCHPLMRKDPTQISEANDDNQQKHQDEATTANDEEHDCDEDESMSMGTADSQPTPSFANHVVSDLKLDKSEDKNDSTPTVVPQKRDEDVSTATNSSSKDEKNTSGTNISIIDNTVFHEFQCMCEQCKKEREAIHHHHLSLSNMNLVDCPRNVIDRSSILSDEWHVKKIENDHGIAELQKSTLLPFVKPKSQVYVRPITNFNGTKHFLGIHSNSDITKYVHNKDPKHFKPFEEFQLITINKIAKEKRAEQSKRYFNLIHILPVKCKPLKRVMNLYKIDDVMYAIFILITAIVKGYKVRKQVRKWRASAKTIQRWWRTILSKRKKLLQNSANTTHKSEEEATNTIVPPTKRVEIISEEQSTIMKDDTSSISDNISSHEETLHHLKLTLCQLFHENQELYTKRAQVLQMIKRLRSNDHAQHVSSLTSSLQKQIRIVESEIQSYKMVKNSQATADYSSVTTSSSVLSHQKSSLERSLKNHFEHSVATQDEQLELERYCMLFNVPVDHLRRLTKLVKRLFDNPSNLEQQEASAEIFAKYFSY